MTDTQKKEFTYRISQATSISMITILYDIALTYLEEAKNCLKAGDSCGFRKALHLAQDTINELRNSLHMTYNPAPVLLELYIYIRKQIAEAIAKQSEEYLAQPCNILVQLRDAYLELEKNTAEESVMVNAQQVYAGLTYGKGSLVETVSDSNRGFFA